MPESLITAIENKIASFVGDMKTPQYNYDWNGVINEDVISAPFPSATLNLIDEKNIDEPEGEDVVGPTGAFSEAYYNALTFEICAGGVHQLGNTPAGKDDLYKALDDLKKTFGIHYTLDDAGASAIMYRGFKLVDESGLYMKSTWLIRYYQSRKEPSEVGEA